MSGQAGAGNLEGKVIVLTGAAGGIGEATARSLHAQGASLLLTDREIEGVQQLADSLGERAAAMAVDVSSWDDNLAMISAAEKEFGAVHGIFLNAGIEGKVGPFESAGDEVWEKVFAVNVHGVRYGIQAALPALRRAGGGTILITCSVAGVRGSAGLSPYVTSKHAVMGLMRTAAAELGIEGIRVNSVNPGPVDNRMMRSIEDQVQPGHGEEVKEGFVSRIPLGRYVTNDEVAATATFLLSDAASGITGANYMVDAGMTAH
ncbi:SDR family oxidoreductase [Halorhodospira halochloris]|uniref:3-oxoacyl-[acyl-carrier protein n=1 Tax=Halorhodospira halochloris TaxID=1052 RepID=A0A0X8XAR9_HALHR|nr:SDR family oxidoreductase [Halorhodospira halochloris]MBK1651751.1 short-chain dehydrogenase [Halorhodospira halochloris]MCG5529673.1 SDR family oxidoreductase [Halorhodospira halochloris]MCG5548527.1 SDR family oxidoreductase [Halorhodospira halochloris]BAU58620.1 3-oxoacyl-[acyl-carrier protein [Halorhodospira halochloris]